MTKQILALLALFLVACSVAVTPAALPSATATLPTPTAALPTPLPTSTLQPYEEYTIDYLRQRTYGGGKIEVLETLDATDQFTTYSIRYPSDGLHIYGFMNVPKGSGPFPVIVSIHGYAPVGKYEVFNPQSDFADFFAQNQFIVIHPGLRNQPPSDDGDNLFRVGMSVDILHLIALLKDLPNLPVELAGAQPDLLGLWGTSLGGEIALRVLTVNPDIKATVLYSPLSGNSLKNSRQLYQVVRDDQFLQDENVPLELIDRISPVNEYYRIISPIQLHHGMDDTTAPISWAVETCSFLEAAGVSVQCIYHAGMEHVFTGEEAEKLQQSALEFYKLHLMP